MSYAKKDCIFLHCLPRGSEVSDEVLLGKKSHVWQQALNRVHVQKSILLYCCLLYTSPSPRAGLLSRMPSSA